VLVAEHGALAGAHGVWADPLAAVTLAANTTHALTVVTLVGTRKHVR
jgi:hypothetical protein